MGIVRPSVLRTVLLILVSGGWIAACQTTGDQPPKGSKGQTGLAAEYAEAGIFATGLVAQMPTDADCPPISLGFASRLNRSGKKRAASHGSYHAGVDWALPEGTPIVAIADGRVVGAGNDPGDPRGNYIAIEHDGLDGGGITSNYTHLSRAAVQAGADVKKGQLIGYVGGTGRGTTFVHLHLNVYGRERVSVRGRVWRYRYDYLQFLSRDMSAIDPAAPRARRVPVAYVDRAGQVHPPNAQVIWPFVCAGKRR